MTGFAPQLNLMVRLAVKWPEASEALTRTPPRLLGNTSVPGDRPHPGGVLGNATAECRRCVPVAEPWRRFAIACMLSGDAIIFRDDGGERLTCLSSAPPS